MVSMYVSVICPLIDIDGLYQPGLVAFTIHYTDMLTTCPDRAPKWLTKAMPYGIMSLIMHVKDP